MQESYTGKKKKKGKEDMTEPQGPMQLNKRTNIHLVILSRKERKREWNQNVPKEIAKNFSNLARHKSIDSVS